MEKDIDKRAKIVLLSAIGINILNGILYTWSSFSLYMMNQWGWANKEASLPYTIHTMFLVISMVILGRIQDTKGPKKIATSSKVVYT